MGRVTSDFPFIGQGTYRYDFAGNTSYVFRASGGTGRKEDRASYYDALDRVRVVDWRNVSDATLSPIEKWVWEEHRYDALGRRVYLKEDRECNWPVSFTFEELECSHGTLRRTVWDGAQELFEIQVPYRFPLGAPQPPTILENDLYQPNLSRNPAGFDPNPLFGRVLYVMGRDVDRPLAILRYNYVDFFTGTTRINFPPTGVSLFWRADGEVGPAFCGDGNASCTATVGGRTATMGVDLPALWFAYDRPRSAFRFFQGSLLRDKRDASGLHFRRNRYYDPTQGRFTQEDPIGLAGGLNLYGYANGDPVNFSDPFGLCPNKEDPRCSIGQQIRAGIEATFDRFLDGVGALGQALRGAMPGLAREAAVEAALAALPVVGEIRGARRVVAVVEATGQFLTENRHVRGVNAARKDFARIGVSADEVGAAIGRSSGWEAVSQGALAGGQMRIGRGTVRYTLQNLGKETVFNAWIP